MKNGIIDTAKTNALPAIAEDWRRNTSTAIRLDAGIANATPVNKHVQKTKNHP
jgi:hypothetical protein